MLGIARNRLKYKHDVIGKEMKEIKTLKDLFLSFTRPKVLSGYVDATVELNLTNGGQNITYWDGIKEYISTSGWSEKFQHGLYYLQYRRFKMKSEFCKWDSRLDTEFRRLHDIEYYGKRKTKCRGCLVTLVISIKTYYTQRIRRLCMQINRKYVRERQDNHDGQRPRLQAFNFKSVYVRNGEDMIVNRGEDLKEQNQIDQLKRQIE